MSVVRSSSDAMSPDDTAAMSGSNNDGSPVSAPLPQPPHDQETAALEDVKIQSAPPKVDKPALELSQVPRTRLLEASWAARRHSDSSIEEEEELSVRVLGQDKTRALAPMSPEQLAQLLASLKADEPVWIDVQAPDEKVVELLTKRFALHPLTAEDCVPKPQTAASAAEREKIEAFVDLNYLFVSYNALGADFWTEFQPLKILLFSNVLVTLHKRRVLAVEAIWEDKTVANARINNNKNNKSNGNVPLRDLGLCMYETLRRMTDRYFTVVEMTITEIDTLEDLVDILTGHEQRDLLKRMSIARRTLVNLSLTLKNKHSIIQTLLDTTRRNPKLAAILPNVHYTHDLEDHVAVMIDRLSMAKNILDSLQSIYVAKASLDVAVESHQISDIMRRLTLGATLILPLTLLTSLWGMNVTVPGQTHDPGDDDTDAFAAIASVVAASLIGGCAYFYKKQWL